MGNISSNHSINNPPKVCCVNCFDIKEIKDFIAANNVHGKCNYCQSNNVYIAEAEEVGRFIIEGISRRYEDAANNVGYEGEYLLPTQTISEVIFDLDVFSAILKNPEVLLADLVRDDGTPYIRKHPYSIYQDEEDFDTWESFCQLVKYKDRYTVFINRENQTSENDHLFFWARILNDLFTYCNSTLEKGAKIYRARLHNSGFKLDNENLTSPPPNKAKNSRMSPSGISVFYGTLEEDTAIAEVQPSIMDSVATGHFEVKNHLNVIDLSRLPSPKSIFNKNYDFHFEENVLPFLQQFTKDISKPIRASDTTIEYVPTQVFTELIRNALLYSKLSDTFVSFEVNGLVYPSSLKNDGTCIVLFRGTDISCTTQDIKEDAWLIFKSAQLSLVNKIFLNYLILRSNSEDAISNSAISNNAINNG